MCELIIPRWVKYPQHKFELYTTNFELILRFFLKEKENYQSKEDAKDGQILLNGNLKFIRFLVERNSVKHLLHHKGKNFVYKLNLVIDSSSFNYELTILFNLKSAVFFYIEKHYKNQNTLRPYSEDPTEIPTQNLLLLALWIFIFLKWKG